MKQTLLFLLIASLPAAAQWRHFGTEQTRFTGDIGLGFTEPINPLARSLNPGWNISGGVGVTHSYFGIMLDGMFTDLGINRALVTQAGANSGHQRYYAATLDPVFHVNSKGPVDFYLTGGGGVYGINTSYGMGNGNAGIFMPGSAVISSQTVYKGGVDGGCGFAFGAGHGGSVRFFAEARLHHVFTGGFQTNFVPVTVGIRF